jgi:hypothetical protein
MLRTVLILLLALSSFTCWGAPTPCGQSFSRIYLRTAFSKVERRVMVEVSRMLRSPELQKIRVAHLNKVPVTIKIGNRTLQYEPGLPASGMTMFGENGFLIGREAFASEEEFRKTLLHETYRLTTSEVGRGMGASQEAVAQETQAAFSFAGRAYGAYFFRGIHP